MTDTLRLSPILDDQPAQQDFLDFASYVRALRELVVHEGTKTPLTLGIFGRWGTGKTTLMQMLEGELRRDRISTVWFNAWQYGREDELWAAFLQSILNKLQADLGLARQILFWLRLLWRRIDWLQVPRLLLDYLVRILIATLPLLLADPLSHRVSDGARLAVQAGGGLLSAALGGWTVIRPLLKAMRQNLTIDFNAFQKISDYREHIAFLDRFREHFSDIVQSLPRQRDKRLAVFIDDLDRCSPERTLQVLDAIKLFVDIRGCVYILGLDIDIVQKAVATKYADDPVAQREYLGKIIQLPFQLPPLTREGMQRFLDQLSLELPDERCLEVFVAGLVVNPREVKRTINVFSLLWNLAAKRAELADLISPVRLAKVVVIQHGYPELHRLIQGDPYNLVQLERHFRERNSNEVPLPEPAEGTQPFQALPFALSELRHFVEDETLGRMLLLHDLPPEGLPDDLSFARMEAEDVAVYFTLTSRAEAPTPQAPPPPPAGATVKAAADLGQGPPVDVTGLVTGQIFGGHYQIVDTIGQGGMAVVYLAQDQRGERRVALKVLRPSFAAPEYQERFRREISVLYRLDHPNLVRVYDSGRDIGQLFYVMEYLPGGPLRSRLREGAMTPRETLDWVLPILDALDYAHQQGVVHRDIKPSSILFDGRGVPKLTDMSIARVLEGDQHYTQTGAVVGTPAYMSPEQFAGSAVGVASDLYSLGVVLYESLAGQPPYRVDSFIDALRKSMEGPPPDLAQVNPQVPAALAQVVMKCLEKDPQARYQSAAELRGALLAALPERT